MKTLFLLDDDSDDKEIFEAALNALNTEVELVYAQDGQQGLDLITAPNPVVPDMFFVDLNMPKVGGLEFIVKMKELPLYKNIPSYVYTTTSSPKEKESCLAAGVTGFIVKHSSYDDLIAELKQIL